MPTPTVASRSVARLVLEFGDLLIAAQVVPLTVAAFLPSSPAVRQPDGTLVPVIPTLVNSVTGQPVTDPASVVPVISVDQTPTVLDEAMVRAALGLGATTPILHYVDDLAAHGEYESVNYYTLRPDVSATSGPRSRARRGALDCLLQALTAQNAVAIINTTFEGTPRFAMITAEGTLTTLNYAHERVTLPSTGDSTPLSGDAQQNAQRIVARDLTHLAMPLVDTNGAALRTWLADPERVIPESPSVRPSLPRNAEEIEGALASTLEPAEAPRVARPRVRTDNATTAPWEGLTVNVDALSSAFRDMNRVAYTISDRWGSVGSTWDSVPTYTMTMPTVG